MTKRLLLAAVLALGAGLASAPAYAQGAKGGGPAKAFDKLDKNKDGFVDEQEAKAPAAAFFRRADTNKDGVIDAAEAKAFVAKATEKNAKAGERVERRIRKLDKDKDGNITQAAAVVPPPWFARVDENKDGKVSKAEIDAFEAKREERAERKKAREDDAADDDDGEDDDKAADGKK